MQKKVFIERKHKMSAGVTRVGSFSSSQWSVTRQLRLTSEIRSRQLLLASIHELLLSSVVGIPQLLLTIEAGDYQLLLTVVVEAGHQLLLMTR